MPDSPHVYNRLLVAARLQCSTTVSTTSSLMRTKESRQRSKSPAVVRKAHEVVEFVSVSPEALVLSATGDSEFLRITNDHPNPGSKLRDDRLEILFLRTEETTDPSAPFAAAPSPARVLDVPLFNK
uniref:MSP domain-containing protein n=1 Tax=Meloidogyne hapla TaxID=6305 RepID=A0A1I8BGL1_MELHA